MAARAKGVVVHLATTNDRNGNPRRIYKLAAKPSEGDFGQFGSFDCIRYVEEGYKGRQAATKAAARMGLDTDDVADLGFVAITPGEYQDIKKRSNYSSGPNGVRPCTGMRPKRPKSP